MKRTNIYRLTLVLIFALALGSHASYARKPASAFSQPAYVQQLNVIIKDAVKYPGFSLKKEERGDITVTFSLTDDGMVKVEKVSAATIRIEDYVKQQLSDVSAKDVLHPYGQKYKVKFRFETI